MRDHCICAKTQIVLVGSYVYAQKDQLGDMQDKQVTRYLDGATD
jgi:hypothetical protein